MKVEGQVLVTTMLDARKAHKSKLSELYAHRWHVELDIRNDHFGNGRAALPDPADGREGAVGVLALAYNLIRLLMAQAARNAGVHPRELSFKHTVQMWTEWTSRTRRSARFDS